MFRWTEYGKVNQVFIEAPKIDNLQRIRVPILGDVWATGSEKCVSVLKRQAI